MRDFDVALLEYETGGYVAEVPALSGCQTRGDTLAEVI
jgi:predicted RNase H-like HicB family nuclease